MSNYLITGANGYVGSMLIKKISKLDKNSKIIALVRDKNRALNIKFNNVEIVETDFKVESLLEIKEKIDYVIHCASITKSHYMVNKPVEVIDSIIGTTKAILEFLKFKTIKSMVYISSMEVYGKVYSSFENKVKEDETGKIDVLNLRSCYPLGKQMAENMCYCYFKEYSVPVKIARLSQTFGKGVDSSDNRVYMQFARSVKENKNIVLHTKGESMGNYCHIDDVVEGILTILQFGKSGEAYNVVNEKNTMTISQMANFVAEKIGKNKIKVVYEIPNENIYGYGAKTGLIMSSKKLEALGWKAKKDLKNMYLDLLEEI